MLSTVATKSRSGSRHASGASGGGALPSRFSLAKGGCESIELEGEVGIEGSHVGLEKEVSGSARRISMDLDGRSLKAESRRIARKNGRVVGVRHHHHAPRFFGRRERLARDGEN